MPRIVKDPKVRKEEIIEAAKNMFMTKGYLQTTTQDIIEEAGISRGLLYYHFKSKEDILYWLVEQQVEPIQYHLKAIAKDEQLTAVEKVQQFMMSTMINEQKATEEDYLLEETMQLPENTFMMDKIYHKLSYAMADYFQEIIEQGNREGSFDVTYPKEAATFLMTSYVFVSNDYALHQNQIDRAVAYLEAFWQLLNRGLNTKEALVPPKIIQ